MTTNWSLSPERLNFAVTDSDAFNRAFQKCFYRILSSRRKINPALDMRLTFSLISFDNGTLVLLTGRTVSELK